MSTLTTLIAHNSRDHNILLLVNNIILYASNKLLPILSLYIPILSLCYDYVYFTSSLRIRWPTGYLNTIQLGF